MNNNLVLTAILLSGLTGCAHAPRATPDAAAYVRPPCSASTLAALSGPTYGPFGVLAKTLAGIDGAGCTGYVQPAAQPIILSPATSRSITCFDLGSGIISCS